MILINKIYTRKKILLKNTSYYWFSKKSWLWSKNYRDWKEDIYTTGWVKILIIIQKLERLGIKYLETTDLVKKTDWNAKITDIKKWNT